MASGTTVSGPSHPTASPTALADHGAEQQSLVEAMPFNSVKSSEYGAPSTLASPVGPHQPMPSSTTGAGTLSEKNESLKTGPATVEPQSLDGSTRLGSVTGKDGERLEIDATLENSPACLFDAVVLPGGRKAVDELCLDGYTLEFVKDQYRHCKTILALGDSSKILSKAGIPVTLAWGDSDPGLLVEGQERNAANAQLFISAIGRHRHAERDRDPPLV